MWFDYSRIHFLLLALATMRSDVSADRLGDLLLAVRVSTTSATISETVSRVMIENVTCDIYVYDEKKAGEHADDLESTAKFYTCVNCVFAGWLQDQLIEFVGRFPTLYQPALLSKYDGLVRKHFDGPDETLDRITGFAARFVNVLFNFMDAYTSASMVDASFLRTLLSFGFAIDYLKTAYADDGAADDGTDRKTSDDAAISRILRTVNAAQMFRALNCDVSAPFYDNALFYGYTKPVPAVTDGPDIRRFLRHIRPAGLETHLERCTGGRMLLRDVLASADVVARELSSVFVYVECPQGKVPPSFDARFAEKVARTHDLDVILWYQKVVYDVLLRLLCFKAKRELLRLPYGERAVEITQGFDVLSFMWAESTDAPPVLANALSSLAAGKALNQQDEAAVTKAVTDFLNSQIAMPPERPLRLPSFNVNVYYKVTDSKLEPFMDAIINRVDDYKCFVRLFRTLNADYRKYYMPHARNLRRVYKFVRQKACVVKTGASGSRADGKGPETDGSTTETVRSRPRPSLPESGEGGSGSNESGIRKERKKKSPVVEIRKTPDNDDNVCSGLIGMYQYCFETLLVLNDCRAAEVREPGAGLSCLPEVGKNIEAVAWYLASASNLRDHSIKKMSFDVAAVQTMAGDRFWLGGLYDELQRHLYVVMAELNKSGLQFCRPPKYGYLLFNNVDVSSTGQHRRFHVWWNKFMPTVGPEPGAKLSKLDVLIGEYRDNARDFVRYRRAVKLYWKGATMSADEIFRNASHAVSGPDYAYALYDVYFRFSLAAMYYEAQSLFKTADVVYNADPSLIKNFHRVFDVFVEKSAVDENCFPRVYRTLIADYNSNVSKAYSRVIATGNFHINSAVFKALKVQFAALGIFIDMDYCELPDANEFSEFTCAQKDSYMTPRVVQYSEKVKKIKDSAFKVKKVYAQFVNYYTDFVPGDHSPDDI